MLKKRKVIKEILSTDKKQRKWFEKRYRKRIDVFAKKWTRSFNKVDKWPRDGGKETHVLAEMFLFSAFNNLLISVKLLTAGLMVPSGTLMRNVLESIALSLLCIHPDTNVAKEVNQNKKEYSYQKAVAKLLNEKNQKRLGLDSAGVHFFDDLRKFYNRYCHSSYFAISSQYNFSSDNAPVFGAFVDPDKSKIYEKELINRKNCCKILDDVVSIITTVSSQT